MWQGGIVTGGFNQQEFDSAIQNIILQGIYRYELVYNGNPSVITVCSSRGVGFMVEVIK